MDPEQIKEKIKIAQEIVKDLDDEYKIETFKIVLEKLLSLNQQQTKPQEGTTLEVQGQPEDSSNPLSNLAKKCDINLQELKNVLDYENNEFILLKKIEGTSDVQKKIVACQIIVTAWMKGKNIEWVKGSLLSELVEKNSLGDFSGLSRNLKNSGFFRKKGQFRGTEYSLTTQGWQEGLKLITKLAQGN